jgi:hypothetical protein
MACTVLYSTLPWSATLYCTALYRRSLHNSTHLADCRPENCPTQTPSHCLHHSSLPLPFLFLRHIHRFTVPPPSGHTRQFGPQVQNMGSSWPRRQRGSFSVTPLSCLKRNRQVARLTEAFSRDTIIISEQRLWGFRGFAGIALPHPKSDLHHIPRALLRFFAVFPLRARFAGGEESGPVCSDVQCNSSTNLV